MGLTTYGAVASTLRTPHLVTIVSGSIITNRLGGNVDNKLLHRFGCYEAAANYHSYSSAVAVGDVDDVQHRDSTSCLGR
jgi:hypothetical protein